MRVRIKLHGPFVPSLSSMSGIRHFGNTLRLLGCVCILGTGVAWFQGSFRESQDRADFLKSLPDNPSRAGLVNGARHPGFVDKSKSSGVLAVLEMERLGVSVSVRPGDNDDLLSSGAGWIPGTSKPGDSGNVGIAAHRDTFFRKLRDTQIGDSFVLVSPSKHIRYVVREMTIVSPDDVRVLRPTTDATLTLVTCYPFTFVGPAPRRFIIRATEDNRDAGKIASRTVQSERRF
jgi:LPXTG-site transpeptidase (sortase) family protein